MTQTSSFGLKLGTQGSSYQGGGVVDQDSSQINNNEDDSKTVVMASACLLTPGRVSEADLGQLTKHMVQGGNGGGGNKGNQRGQKLNPHKTTSSNNAQIPTKNSDIFSQNSNSYTNQGEGVVDLKSKQNALSNLQQVKRGSLPVQTSTRFQQQGQQPLQNYGLSPQENHNTKLVPPQSGITHSSSQLSRQSKDNIERKNDKQQQSTGFSLKKDGGSNNLNGNQAANIQRKKAEFSRQTTSKTPASRSTFGGGGGRNSRKVTRGTELPEAFMGCQTIGCKCAICKRQEAQIRAQSQDQTVTFFKEQKERDLKFRSDQTACDQKMENLYQKMKQEEQFAKENPGQPQYAFSNSVWREMERIKELNDLEYKEGDFYTFEQQSFEWLMQKLSSGPNDRYLGCIANIPETLFFQNGGPQKCIKTDEDGFVCTTKGPIPLQQLQKTLIGMYQERSRVYQKKLQQLKFERQAAIKREALERQQTQVKLRQAQSFKMSGMEATEESDSEMSPEKGRKNKNQSALSNGQNSSARSSLNLSDTNEDKSPVPQAIGSGGGGVGSQKPLGGASSTGEKKTRLDGFLIRFKQGSEYKDKVISDSLIHAEFDYRASHPYWQEISSISLTPISKQGLGKLVTFEFLAPCFDEMKSEDRKGFKNLELSKYGKVRYNFSQFGPNTQLAEEELRKASPTQYCLKQCYKICYFVQKVHNIDIMKMKVDFYEDTFGHFWLLQTYNLMTRQGRPVPSASANLLANYLQGKGKELRNSLEEERTKKQDQQSKKLNKFVGSQASSSFTRQSHVQNQKNSTLFADNSIQNQEDQRNESQQTMKSQLNVRQSVGLTPKSQATFFKENHPQYFNQNLIASMNSSLYQESFMKTREASQISQKATNHLNNRLGSQQRDSRYATTTSNNHQNRSMQQRRSGTQVAPKKSQYLPADQIHPLNERQDYRISEFQRQIHQKSLQQKEDKLAQLRQKKQKTSQFVSQSQIQPSFARIDSQFGAQKSVQQPQFQQDSNYFPNSQAFLDPASQIGNSTQITLLEDTTNHFDKSAAFFNPVTHNNSSHGQENSLKQLDILKMMLKESELQRQDCGQNSQKASFQRLKALKTSCPIMRQDKVIRYVNEVASKTNKNKDISLLISSQNAESKRHSGLFSTRNQTTKHQDSSVKNQEINFSEEQDPLDKAIGCQNQPNLFKTGEVLKDFEISQAQLKKSAPGNAFEGIDKESRYQLVKMSTYAEKFDKIKESLQAQELEMQIKADFVHLTSVDSKQSERTDESKVENKAKEKIAEVKQKSAEYSTKLQKKRNKLLLNFRDRLENKGKVVGQQTTVQGHNAVNSTSSRGDRLKILNSVQLEKQNLEEIDSEIGSKRDSFSPITSAQKKSQNDELIKIKNESNQDNQQTKQQEKVQYEVNEIVQQSDQQISFDQKDSVDVNQHPQTTEQTNTRNFLDKSVSQKPNIVSNLLDEKFVVNKLLEYENERVIQQQSQMKDSSINGQSPCPVHFANYTDTSLYGIGGQDGASTYQALGPEPIGTASSKGYHHLNQAFIDRRQYASQIGRDQHQNPNKIGQYFDSQPTSVKSSFASTFSTRQRLKSSNGEMKRNTTRRARAQVQELYMKALAHRPASNTHFLPIEQPTMFNNNSSGVSDGLLQSQQISIDANGFNRQQVIPQTSNSVYNAGERFGGSIENTSNEQAVGYQPTDQILAQYQLQIQKNQAQNMLFKDGRSRGGVKHSGTESIAHLRRAGKGVQAYQSAQHSSVNFDPQRTRKSSQQPYRSIGVVNGSNQQKSAIIGRRGPPSFNKISQNRHQIGSFDQISGSQEVKNTFMNYYGKNRQARILQSHDQPFAKKTVGVGATGSYIHSSSHLSSQKTKDSINHPTNLMRSYQESSPQKQAKNVTTEAPTY